MTPGNSLLSLRDRGRRRQDVSRACSRRLRQPLGAKTGGPPLFGLDLKVTGGVELADYWTFGLHGVRCTGAEGTFDGSFSRGASPRT